MQEEHTDDHLINQWEAVAYLGIDTGLWCDLRKQGKGPPFSRHRGRLWFRRSALDEWYDALLRRRREELERWWNFLRESREAERRRKRESADLLFQSQLLGLE